MCSVGWSFLRWVGLGLVMAGGLAGAMSPARAAPKVAVLEAIATPAVEADTRQLWTATVREAVRAHAPADWIVLTRENIEAFLPPGVDLADCEGECEIETGRKVGAEYVVTARVVADGPRRTVTVALHATVSGRFLGQGQGRATAIDVEEALAQATRDALAPVQPVARPAAESVAIVDPEPLRWYGAPVLLVRSPHGAFIHALGRNQGRTPVRIPTKGWQRMRIRAEAPGFRSRTYEVELSGRSGAIEVQLERTGAELAIDYPLQGAKVRIDGGPPVESLRHVLDAGQHAVEVSHPCGALTRFTVDVEPGEPIRRRLWPEVTCGRLRVESAVPGARLRIDGRMRALPYVSKPMQPRSMLIEVLAEGHSPAKKMVTVPERGVLTVTLNPEPVWVPVRVRAERWDGAPCTGALSIDGKPVGQLPWSGRTLAGHRSLATDCRGRVRRVVRLDGAVEDVVLTDPGDTIELIARSDAGTTGLLTVRKWSSSRRAGRGRASIGGVLGMVGIDEDDDTKNSVPYFGLEVGVGIGVTNWLELGASGVVGGGPEDCEPGEGVRTNPDGTTTQEACGYGFALGRLDLRVYLDHVVLETGIAGLSESANLSLGGASIGPHFSVGATF